MKTTGRFWILIGILMVFNLVIYLTRWGGDKTLLYISNTLPILCSLISSVCLFLAFKAFRVFDLSKVAWLMILIGIALYFIAETTYAILEIAFSVDMNNTFPTIADYLWCTGYFPIFAGFILIFQVYRRGDSNMRDSKGYLLQSMLFLVLITLVLYYILLPIIKDTETKKIAKLFYLFYPTADIFLIIPAMMMMFITGFSGKIKTFIPWKYLALGFFCFTAGDLIYSYLVWLDLYENGNYTDIAWNLGYLVIGLAGLYQKELTESTQSPPSAQAVPASILN